MLLVLLFRLFEMHFSPNFCCFYVCVRSYIFVYLFTVYHKVLSLRFPLIFTQITFKFPVYWPSLPYHMKAASWEGVMHHNVLPSASIADCYSLNVIEFLHTWRRALTVLCCIYKITTFCYCITVSVFPNIRSLRPESCLRGVKGKWHINRGRKACFVHVMSSALITSQKKLEAIHFHSCTEVFYALLNEGSFTLKHWFACFTVCLSLC